MNVLVVDDDESTLALLLIELSRTGWHVAGARNGPQALEALRAGAFDWLVVDGQMAPMDGFEVAEKAKALQPAIRVVMVSGVYDDADIGARPIGKLFSKPLDVDALAAHLRSPA